MNYRRSKVYTGEVLTYIYSSLRVPYQPASQSGYLARWTFSQMRHGMFLSLLLSSAQHETVCSAFMKLLSFLYDYSQYE